MLAEERVKVDSSDARSFYSHSSTVTSGRLIRICVKRTSNREACGCFWMRFCIDAVILTGFPCWEFGELLVMPRCWCLGNIGQGSLYPQLMD
ncbi:hypothetical protein Goshw_005786 [Gossypium schwendimanii]|uniref:Uncharacterized protein n=1 Tax=Gossypium schwendimanii TaxID=34291 RepID=A0A7J9LUB1_GOSSC|nr:hypothetical protein [Gossypium schwendimanii]